MAKQIDVLETTQKILDKANRSNGIFIDVPKLNAVIKGRGARKFLKEACEFLHVEPVYEE